MINEFYEKRSKVESSLNKLGFEEAGVFVVETGSSATEKSYWFTKDCIIVLSCHGAISQEVGHVYVYRVNEVSVEHTVSSLGEDICLFIERYQSLKYVKCARGFLSVFCELSPLFASDEDTLLCLSKELPKFSEDFKKTFEKQLSELFSDSAVEMQSAFPDFFLMPDNYIGKALKVYDTVSEKRLLYNRLGADCLTFNTIKHMQEFNYKEIDKESMLSLVSTIVKKFAGIFNKTAIKEYIELCFDDPRDVFVLEEALGDISEYPFAKAEKVDYQLLSGQVDFRPAILDEHGIWFHFGDNSYCSLDSDFEPDGSCFFQPKYVEPFIDGIIILPGIAETLYNVLAWFPEKYEDLSDVVKEYVNFFEVLQDQFSPLSPLDSREENPYYLKDEDLGENPGLDSGISCMNAFSPEQRNEIDPLFKSSKKQEQTGVTFQMPDDSEEE